MPFLPKDVQAAIRSAVAIAVLLQSVRQATTHAAVAIALLRDEPRTAVYATAVRAALRRAMCHAATATVHAVLHRIMYHAVAVRVVQVLSLREAAAVAEAQAWAEVAAGQVAAVVDALVVDADK